MYYSFEQFTQGETGCEIQVCCCQGQWVNVTFVLFWTKNGFTGCGGLLYF